MTARGNRSMNSYSDRPHLVTNTQKKNATQLCVTIDFHAKPSQQPSSPTRGSHSNYVLSIHSTLINALKFHVIHFKTSFETIIKRFGSYRMRYNRPPWCKAIKIKRNAFHLFGLLLFQKKRIKNETNLNENRLWISFWSRGKGEISLFPLPLHRSNVKRFIVAMPPHTRQSSAHFSFSSTRHWK